MTAPSSRVRIIAAPFGDAPLWVREAWIGLELPLAMPAPVFVECFSVLSPQRTLFARLWDRVRGRSKKVKGYIVMAAAAIELLKDAHPPAAAWWAEHAPVFRDPRQPFLFNENACEPISTS